VKIVPFECERLMSRWQNVVEYDLSPSGVPALELRDLVSPEEMQDIYETTHLRYIQTNGTRELKEAVCGLYGDCRPENVLITNGSTEGGFDLTWHLVEPGDEVVVVVPNYLQFAGLAQTFGARVVSCRLDGSRGWALDPDELRGAVTARTKAIYVSNPNNPTGAILTDAERAELIAAAASVDAWLISDEVYRGAELLEGVTPSMWGDYAKLIVLDSLSKAYALPGLRIGWMLAPADLIDRVWSYHDYTTITATALGDRLARLALQPQKTAWIRERVRSVGNESLPLLEQWVAERSDDFTLVPPKIAGVAFVRYGIDMPSMELAERMIRERNVLIVPGSAFSLDGHIRIGYCAKGIREGLVGVGEAYQAIAAKA
jgi:aspartate/methionine/tyrosine aminotransferase